ncbi:hypothetical protein D1871_03200 [Nakamurella silvestris]|nr:hypothetical protein D1871_03200 [Nakamurella silvestris]
MDFGQLYLTGVLAGLGVAVPLGAIGLLLVRQGLESGFRVGAAGAGAVALVDTLYCVLALVAGAVAAPWVRALGSLPALIGGGLLIAIGGTGLVRLRHPADPRAIDAATRTGLQVFGVFAGLTAVNPATLVYFAALITALDTSHTLGGGTVTFVLGVGSASLLWQLGLVAVGATLGTRIGPTGQRLLSLCGFSLVAVLGGGAVISALV